MRKLNWLVLLGVPLATGCSSGRKATLTGGLRFVVEL
jgi:hypothetical protein